MGKRRTRAALASQVEDLQRRLSLTYVVVEELADCLIRHNGSPEQTDALYQRARSHLDPIASEVEAMAKMFWLGHGYLKAPPDVALRGTLVSVFMGAQIVALDMTLDAMTMVGGGVGPDEDFLRESIHESTTVYLDHASMIEAALHADLESLMTIRQLYGADLAGSSAEFHRRVDDFKLVKDRMLAGT